MGDTGYALLFYNIDASTLEKHTKEDWNMTTLYVPQQNWGSKDSNHLQFLFHLNTCENGILIIPMQPGTIIYFSGYLLTHQQMHNGGLCSKHGCCLNLSAYANKNYRLIASNCLFVVRTILLINIIFKVFIILTIFFSFWLAFFIIFCIVQIIISVVAITDFFFNNVPFMIVATKVS